MAKPTMGPEEKALDAPSDRPSPKRQYHAPEVRSLGTVKDLTLNSSTTLQNDTAFPFTANTKHPG
jgi:hypothetical protein